MSPKKSLVTLLSVCVTVLGLLLPASSVSAQEECRSYCYDGCPQYPSAPCTQECPVGQCSGQTGPCGWDLDDWDEQIQCGYET